MLLEPDIEACGGCRGIELSSVRVVHNQSGDALVLECAVDPGLDGVLEEDGTAGGIVDDCLERHGAEGLVAGREFDEEGFAGQGKGHAGDVVAVVKDEFLKLGGESGERVARFLIVCCEESGGV